MQHKSKPFGSGKHVQSHTHKKKKKEEEKNVNKKNKQTNKEVSSGSQRGRNFHDPRKWVIPRTLNCTIKNS
jgi:hypothetical protein